MKFLANKMLTVSQAIRIADTQFDLGVESKKNMAIALTGSYNEEKRHKAYAELDPISKFIVEQILDDEDIDGAKITMQYIIRNLQAIQNKLNMLKHEEEKNKELSGV